MKGAALHEPAPGSGGKGGSKGSAAKGGKGAGNKKGASQPPPKRPSSTDQAYAKDPDLYNSSGKLMCYAHYEGRCNKTPEECGKSHGTPTGRQLIKYNEHKARAKDKPKPASKSPAAARAAPPPKALPAPAPEANGPAPKAKARGRSRGRSKSKGRTPDANAGAVAVPVAGFPGGAAAVASQTADATSR